MKARKVILCLSCLSALALLLIFSQRVTDGIRNGLTVCAQTVIPSLFPFMVLSSFTDLSGAADGFSDAVGKAVARIFNIPPKASAAVLMSFISGYPVGASMIKGLYDSGVCDKKTAARMLSFAVNAGPAMVLVAVGQCMLGSYKTGMVLLASHLGASVIIGIVSGLLSKPVIYRSKGKAIHLSAADAFTKATSDSCLSLLKICGYVVVFSAAMQVLPGGVRWPVTVLEVTNGCGYAVQNGLGIYAISAILGFSGVSVMCQVYSLCGGIISPPRLLLSRICHGAISAAICFILARLLPDSVFAAKLEVASPASYGSESILFSVALLIMAAAFLLSVSGKEKLK